MKTSTKKLCRRAMLLAAAIIMGYIEAALPISFGISGFKIGLANLVILTVMRCEGLGTALLINILRILLLQLLFGNIYALCLSLAGGICATFAMYVALKLPSVTAVGASALGGSVHNAAQTVAAALIMSTAGIIKLLPILLVLGAACGILCGIAAAKCTDLLLRTPLFDKK